MNRRRIRTVAVGMLLALVAAACGGNPTEGSQVAAEDSATPDPTEEETDEDPQLVIEGEPPTPETLAGIWRNETPGWEDLLAHFDADGTFVVARRGNLGNDPADTTGYPPVIASYEIDGRTVSVKFREEACAPKGSTFEWEAGVSKDGRLHNVFLSVPGGTCPPHVGLEFRWVRVSPSSPASAGITPDMAWESGLPPTDVRQLLGIWLLHGSGYLLRIFGDGTFLLADDGRLLTDPDDQGTFEVVGEGTLILTSGEESRICSEGDSWVWRDARRGGRALGATESADDCARDLGPELTWMLMSP